MKLDKDIVGTVGQYGSGVLLLVGIGVEIAYQADIGFIFITIGGFAWGLFTKIKGH